MTFITFSPPPFLLDIQLTFVFVRTSISRADGIHMKSASLKKDCYLLMQPIFTSSFAEHWLIFKCISPLCSIQCNLANEDLSIYKIFNYENKNLRFFKNIRIGGTRNHNLVENMLETWRSIKASLNWGKTSNDTNSNNDSGFLFIHEE